VAVKAAFTKSELAKYPFLREAVKYVGSLDLTVGDLVEIPGVLSRAEERVRMAVQRGEVYGSARSSDVEILSFPAAVMIAAATRSQQLKRRYALAEAKRAYSLLRMERPEVIMAVAENFGWRLILDESAAPYCFRLHFADYLRYIGNLREGKWRLVNRALTGGFVLLTREEAARLLSEEVRRHVEERLEEELKNIPKEILAIAENVKLLVPERAAEGWEVPKELKLEAFPPCMKALYSAASKGQNVSHAGRFALTSFLVNVGMPAESILELFRNSPDFKERVTLYQIEHIAGEKGSRTKYTPPRCDTLRTHGLCVEPDELCKKVRHPLSYYRKAIKRA